MHGSIFDIIRWNISPLVIRTLKDKHTCIRMNKNPLIRTEQNQPYYISELRRGKDKFKFSNFLLINEKQIQQFVDLSYPACSAESSLALHIDSMAISERLLRVTAVTSQFI